MELSEASFIPIVCIPSQAKLNIKSQHHIAQTYNLNKIIKSYTDEIIPDYNIIYGKILALKIDDRKIMKDHILWIKQKQRDTNNNKDNKCPLCGGNLVERKGKYGYFIGCSNYPKCKYTKKQKQ